MSSRFGKCCKLFRLTTGSMLPVNASPNFFAHVPNVMKPWCRRSKVEDRNPVELSIGDKIWIEPGSKTTLFDTVDDCSAANDKSCEYVTLPMVTSIAAHADGPFSSSVCAMSADLKPAGVPSPAAVPTCAARPGATRSRSCGHVRPRFPMAVAGSRR